MQTEIKKQIEKILRVHKEIEFLNIDVIIENKTLSAFVCFDNRVVVVMDNGVFWDTTTIERLKNQVQEYFTLDFFENFTVLIVSLKNEKLKEIRKTNFENSSNMNYLF